MASRVWVNEKILEILTQRDNNIVRNLKDLARFYSDFKRGIRLLGFDLYEGFELYVCAYMDATPLPVTLLYLHPYLGKVSHHAKKIEIEVVLNLEVSNNSHWGLGSFKKMSDRGGRTLVNSIPWLSLLV